MMERCDRMGCNADADEVVYLPLTLSVTDYTLTLNLCRACRDRMAEQGYKAQGSPGINR